MVSTRGKTQSKKVRLVVAVLRCLQILKMRMRETIICPRLMATDYSILVRMKSLAQY